MESSRGRQTHGGANVRGSRVLQDRSQDHARSVEMSARLAAPVPISLAEVLSAASMGGFGARAHTAGVQVCGGCPPVGVADTTPQSGLDWGEERGLGQLELDRVSARKKPPDKNWDLGRQYPPGLRLAGLDVPAMAFRDRGVWNTVPESCRRTVHQRHSAGPDAALRSEHRHQQAIQKSGCDNEKREMAKRQNSDEVRETCAIGSGVSIVQRHADRFLLE